MEYKRIIKLKQHSPLIHFQHEQEGATLRATEVKPRLDRFIWNDLQVILPEVFEEFKSEISETNFPLTESKKMGAYKMWIKGTADPRKSKWVADASKNVKAKLGLVDNDLLSGTAYFADNDKIKDEKYDEAKKAQWYPDLEVHIFSYKPRITELIEKVLPVFFICNNFGSRKTKGFGGFTVENTSIEYFKEVLLKKFEHVYEKNPADLRKVKNDYLILKSGDRDNSSKLDEYFWGNLKVAWEKNVVGGDLIENVGSPQQRDYRESPKYQFVRALLGLANTYHYPWKHHKSKVETVNISWVETENNKKIERFASPLLFKFFGKTVFIVHEKNATEKIENQVFKFHSNHDKKGITMKVPESFNLAGFLDKALPQLDYKKL